MLVKFKRSRSHDEDRRLALWLATAAGLLNAMALGAFGFFPSHMSGNTSQLSSEVSTTDIRNIIFFGTIIIAFVFGSVVSRLLVIWGQIKNVRTVFCQVLMLEGLALIGISLYEIYSHTPTSNREIIVLLCFLMGVHNSTSSQLSNGRVRSTHITGTLTDAGIAFASVLAAMLRRDFSRDSEGQKSQLLTHTITISSFLTGGIAGLVLFQWLAFKAITGVGVMLICVALGSIISIKRRVRSRAQQ
ncbi:MAG TPA: YoaK family protein [Enterobacteriaceae bacterium]|nr:YoaK family protein [Enterobacteriaceae bacterium]